MGPYRVQVIFFVSKKYRPYVIKIYHYDFCQKRERTIKMVFNHKLQIAMNISLDGDIEQFLKSFGEKISCDRWIEFFGSRFLHKTPPNVYLGRGIESPEAVMIDECKLMNSHGDSVSTTHMVWGESWSEDSEIYRASILVFH